MATWYQQLTGLLGVETVQPVYGQHAGYGYTGNVTYSRPNVGAAYVPTTTSFTMPITTTSDAPPPLVPASNGYPPRNPSFTQTYTVTQPQQTVQSVPRVPSFTRYDPAPATSAYPASTTTTYPAGTTTNQYNQYAVPSAVPRNASFTRNPSFTRTSSFTAPVVTTTAPAVVSSTTAPPAYNAPRIVKTSSFTSYPAAPVVKQPSFTAVPVVRKTSFTAMPVQDPRIAAMNQAYSGGDNSMSILRPPPPPPPASDGFDRASYPDAYPRDQSSFHYPTPGQSSPRDPNERPAYSQPRRKKGCCI